MQTEALPNGSQACGVYMAFSVFRHVRVTGVSMVVPAETIRLRDEAGYYGNDPRRIARIARMAGFDQRRIAPEGITASDLCVQAAQRLLEESGTDKHSIDALVFVTQTPDYPAPASAFLQQDALGLPKTCACFDVNLGCAGYVYGLWLSGCMLESRACSRVLLLAGDGAFRHLPQDNRVLAPVFGDAGSATLLEYAADAPALSFSIGSDGGGHEHLIRPGGGARIPHLPGSEAAYNEIVRDKDGMPWSVGGFGNIGNTWMDGMAVFNFTMDVVPPHITDHMARLGLSPADVEYLVLHQANKQIIQHIAESCGFPPEKAPWETFSKYGNQSVASIPGVLCDQLRAACDAGSPLRLLLCGYGIGLTWASCFGDFTGLRCLGIRDFLPPPRVAGHAERIASWHEKFRGNA